MPSIIPGFTYDIFISYRQKDNKGGRQGAQSWATQFREAGWVSEFVEALKTELESTFKEEISVYFDINPHDGLLETHDVDESLKGKLKCLVFIPIISRTYCDPKSFAWEHEFKAFVELASKDQFGLKVKLPNGNVASRVLPVRIHDLDISDIKECESVIGGVLRGIEFIYKEAGIDKPLAPGDNEKKNLNNTTYRIQIIKVAHAIKEIILGMKTEPIQEAKEKDQHKEQIKDSKEDGQKVEREIPTKVVKVKFLIPAAVVMLLIVAGIIAYPKLFKRDPLERLRTSGERISVAVMPFQNMTNDTNNNVWQKGIQFNLITFFSNYTDELKVNPAESINNLIKSKGISDYASLTPTKVRSLSRLFEGDVIIFGSINQSGSTTRINAQLVDSKTGEVFKPFQIDGSSIDLNILYLIDSIAVSIKDYLILSQLKQKEGHVATKYESTKSPDAYLNFISGLNTFSKSDFVRSREYFANAIHCDSNYTLAKIWLSVTYLNLGRYQEGREIIKKVYDYKDQLSEYNRNKAEDIYAWFTVGPQGRIKYLKRLIALDNLNPVNYSTLGNAYRLIGDYENAIYYHKQSMKICKKYKIIPPLNAIYINLGKSYHAEGLYFKEKRLYRKGEHDYPNNPFIIRSKAILAFSERKIKEGDYFINKYISVCKENSESDLTIITNLALIYSDAGIMNKAEEFYRQALSLEPDSLGLMNTLAYFLIDKDRNIPEGLVLADTLLNYSSDNYNYLHTKGWGLFKQGKYQEAKDILQKSWDLRMKNGVYGHEAFLHLEAAKKAVAEQKRTER